MTLFNPNGCLSETQKSRIILSNHHFLDRRYWGVLRKRPYAEAQNFENQNRQVRKSYFCLIVLMSLYRAGPWSREGSDTWYLSYTLSGNKSISRHFKVFKKSYSSTVYLEKFNTSLSPIEYSELRSSRTIWQFNSEIGSKFWWQLILACKQLVEWKTSISQWDLCTLQKSTGPYHSEMYYRDALQRCTTELPAWEEVLRPKAPNTKPRLFKL